MDRRIMPCHVRRSSVTALVVALLAAGCGEQRAPLTGSIRIGGSRTLAPLTTAMARRFMAQNPRVHIALAASAADAGSVRVAVAGDAAILMVNRANPVRCLTTAQLFQIWRGNSEVTTSWAQVDGLEPSYGGHFQAWGPGTETETFAFFNRVVTGKRAGYRDYDNALERESDVLAGIAHDVGALGYADYRSYRQGAGSVRAIAIDSGSGCVAPTPQTIADGTFRPLARKLFVSASAQAFARPALAAFLQFYLDDVRTVAPAVGFVPLTPAQVRASKAAVARAAAARRPTAG